MQRVLVVMIALILSGCAQPLPVTPYAPVDPASVVVSTASDLPAGAVLTGSVAGRACPLHKGEGRPLKTVATNRLKAAAARIGADGVMHMRTRMRDFAISCPFGVDAWGTAYKIVGKR